MAEVETPEAPAGAEDAAAAAAGIVAGVDPPGGGIPGEEAAPDAPAGEGPAEGEPAGGEQPDPLERIDERFSELRADLGIAAPPAAPAAAPAAAELPEPGVAGLFDRTAPDPEATGEPEEPDYNLDAPDLRDPDARAQVQEYVNDLVEQRVQETLNPFFEGEMTRRRVEAAQELEHQYPELARNEVAGPVLDLQRGLLHELAVEAAGPQIGPVLAQRLQQTPAGVKLAKALYMASKADVAARSSGTPASEQEVTLEQPGARAPTGGPDDDLAAEKAAIMNSGGNPAEVPSFLMG